MIRIGKFQAAAWAASVLLAAPAASFAADGTRKLNDTGAASCYVDKFSTTDCAGTRQDADYGRDKVYPDDADGRLGFSFQKVCNSGDAAGEGSCPVDPASGTAPEEWGCVKDRVTGLMWEHRLGDTSIRGTRSQFTNSGDKKGNALWYVEKMNKQKLCGHSGWRMPTVAEMLSVTDFGASEGVDRNWFPDIPSGDFWTSEKVINETNISWTVNPVQSTSSSIVGDSGAPLSLHYLRIVRGNEAPTDISQRFVKSGDGQVYDSFTGLTWLPCGDVCNGKPIKFGEGLSEAKRVSSESGLPWRLPNIKELESLAILNSSSAYPPIKNKNGAYMSSTPILGKSKTSYWAALLGEGEGHLLTIDNVKDDGTYLILVRNGQ